MRRQGPGQPQWRSTPSIRATTSTVEPTANARSTTGMAASFASATPAGPRPTPSARKATACATRRRAIRTASTAAGWARTTALLASPSSHCCARRSFYRAWRPRRSPLARAAPAVASASLPTIRIGVSRATRRAWSAMGLDPRAARSAAWRRARPFCTAASASRPAPTAPGRHPNELARHAMHRAPRAAGRDRLRARAATRTSAPTRHARRRSSRCSSLAAAAARAARASTPSTASARTAIVVAARARAQATRSASIPPRRRRSRTPTAPRVLHSRMACASSTARHSPSLTCRAASVRRVISAACAAVVRRMPTACLAIHSSPPQRPSMMADACSSVLLARSVTTIELVEPVRLSAAPASARAIMIA